MYNQFNNRNYNISIIQNASYVVTIIEVIVKRKPAWLHWFTERRVGYKGLQKATRYTDL